MTEGLIKELFALFKQTIENERVEPIKPIGYLFIL